MYSLTPAFIFSIIFPNPVQRDVNNRLCITTWLDKSTQGSHWSLGVYKSDFPITPMMKSQITIIVLIQGLMIFPTPENCLIVLNRWRPPPKKNGKLISHSGANVQFGFFLKFTQIFGFLVLSNRILVFIYVTNLRVEHVEVWDSLWEFQPSLVKGLEEVASPRSNLAISGRRQLLFNTYNKYSQ